MTSKNIIPKTKGEGEISEAITSRIRRGISHYGEFAIRHIAEGVYLVESSTRCGSYRVEISLTEDGMDHCNCVDFAIYSAETGCCKHTISAAIAEAKLQENRRAPKPSPQADYIAECGGKDKVLERKRAEVRERGGSGKPNITKNAEIAAALERMGA